MTIVIIGLVSAAADYGGDSKETECGNDELKEMAHGIQQKSLELLVIQGPRFCSQAGQMIASVSRPYRVECRRS
ncbi:MAG: hypothetical protein OXE83_02000 [Gammaproteobacteria bacterium]|nr:hypothetical protein [Gammaproteobacteria bacterium]